MSKNEIEADKIRLAILKIPKGKLFSLAEFRHLATQNNIKQVFHRLVKKNEIIRVSRGIYMREKIVFSEDGYKPNSSNINQINKKNIIFIIPNTVTPFSLNRPRINLLIIKEDFELKKPISG